jgi:hypothetical protein
MKSRGLAGLRATNLWQAAFVRAFPQGKDKWKTRFVSLLSYVFGIFLLIPLMSASLVDDYMTSPTPLEQMRKLTGVLVGVTSCHRCPQLFEVLQQSGESVEFGTAKNNLLKLKPYIGTEVTVWSQIGFHVPSSRETKIFTNETYEIKIHKSGEMLNQYQAKRSEWIARDSKDHWWFLGFLLLGIWLPFRVVWKHRKPV